MKGHSVGNIKRCEAGEIGGGIKIIKGFRHAVKEKGVSLGAYQASGVCQKFKVRQVGPRSKMSKFISCTVFYLYLFFKYLSFCQLFFLFFLRFSLCPVDIAMRLSALCAVLSLLVVFFLIPEVTSCYVKVNGCSIPGDLSFFYKTKFRLACDKHDVCYYCVRLIFFLKKKRGYCKCMRTKIA